MNSLIIFDYIYYRIAYLYAYKFGYEEQKEYIGVLFISLIQLINAITLIGFIKPLEEIVNEPIFVFVFGYLLLVLLNFIRYNTVIKFSDLNIKWEKENRKQKVIRVICIFGYCILSIYLMSLT